MSDRGYIIKVIPTAEHVKELRDKASAQLNQKDYSNQKIIDHFKEHFDLVVQEEVTATNACSEKERQAFIKMTPLLFNVDDSLIDWTDVTELTVSALVLIGKHK